MLEPRVRVQSAGGSQEAGMGEFVKGLAKASLSRNFSCFLPKAGQFLGVRVGVEWEGLAWRWHGAGEKPDSPSP